MEEKKTPSLDEKKQSKDINFGYIITFLGILGLFIGLLSLYVYAVNNGWISEFVRLIIGFIFSIILFGVGYYFIEKNSIWANFLVGGGIFLSFLTVGIGVFNYKLLSEITAFAILALIIALSGTMSKLYSSRIIAYYTVVGGYFVPFLSNTFDNVEFNLLYILILTTFLFFISSKFNWADLRFTSFLFLMFFFNLFYYASLVSLSNLILGVAFILLMFLLFNLSSLIYAIKKNEGINILDIITLNLNSFVFVPLLLFYLGDVFYLDSFLLGIVLLLFCSFYIFEYFMFRAKNTLSFSVSLSLISSALISLNVGLLIILNKFNLDFLFILFIIEWFVFLLLSENEYAKENNLSYLSSFSFFFLFLIIIWYLYILRFDSGLIHGSIFLLFIAFVPLGSFYMIKKQNKLEQFYGIFTIISSYAFLFSLSKYLVFFIDNQSFFSISLSVLWLAFSLFLYIKFSEIDFIKNFSVIVLIIILLKIAFIDLFLLEGFYRILGFIILGIIMIIGGYYMTTDKKNK